MQFMPAPKPLLNPCTEFALETHRGDYATWPSRTRQLRRGAPTNCLLPGYSLLHQYARAFANNAPEYLLVIDCDCPFEEATTVVLLSNDLQRLGKCTFAASYASWLLRACEPFVASDGNVGVALSFGERENWKISIEQRRTSSLLNRVWPRLRRKRCADAPQEDPPNASPL